MRQLRYSLEPPKASQLLSAYRDQSRTYKVVHYAVVRDAVAISLVLFHCCQETLTCRRIASSVAVVSKLAIPQNHESPSGFKEWCRDSEK